MDEKTRERITSQLEEFLQSEEGKAAIALLASLDRHITLLEGEPEGGYADVFYLSGEGLRKSHEAVGFWSALSSHVRAPIDSPATAEEVVWELMLGPMQPDRMMTTFKANLESLQAE